MHAWIWCISSLKVLTNNGLAFGKGRYFMARPTRPDRKEEAPPAKAAAEGEQQRHRTEPIPETVTEVHGYPKKLVLYKLDASPFWWVRTFHKGKIYRRTTRTEVKREATLFARNFYDEVVSGQVLKPQRKEDKMTFAKVAEAYMKSKQAQVARKDLTEMTYKIMDYRMKKVILPALGEREITAIHYDDLEELLDDLSHDELSGSTISGYMKAARSVFNYAYKRRDIANIPHFPTVDAEHQPRGYFTNKEYRKLWNRARKLVGKRFEYRKLTDEDGKELQGKFFAEGECEEGRLIRKTTITPELAELVIFMVNSYCRPTDIKNIKHKHVTVVRGEHTFLRLNAPPTKGHDEPFVTMKQAVAVYERLTAYNASVGRDTGPEAYVFFPNYENRDYALKELMRQFAVLTWNLALGKGPKGEPRTIYSLRHTCFMFRLMYGEKMETLTLARNGRTSVEMVEKHYASQLVGEHNIDMIQSRRKRHQKRDKTETEAQ